MPTAPNTSAVAEPADDDSNDRIHACALAPPPFAVHRLGGQEQPERDEAQVVDQVLRVDDALREVVEVIGDRQVGRSACRRSGPTKLPIQLMTHSSRNTAKVDDAGDDLVLRQARDEQAERDEAAAQQQQAEVAVTIGFHSGLPKTNRTPMWISVTASIARVERHRAEELADDDLRSR